MNNKSIINNDIILIHDHFLYTGGAEKLVKYLIDDLKCDVATFYISNQTFDLSQYKIITLKKKWPGKLLNVWKYLYFVFKTSFLKKYKTVIFSGDAVFASFSASKNAKKIYYCHTPPRYLFDQYKSSKSKRSIFIRWLYIIWVHLQRWLYIKHIKNVDIVITNSLNTANRLKKYCNVDSQVIYPPIDVNFFSTKSKISAKKAFKDKDYYFSFARLDRLKNVDKIIQAFKILKNKNLIIASSGPMENELKKLAKDQKNIVFVGILSDDELKDYIHSSICTIYIPTNEDFGMSAVESMACGIPVIGVDDGGLKESIIHEKTGFLLDKNYTINDLCNAINYMDLQKALSMHDNCIDQSKKFDIKIFLQSIKNIIYKK